MNSKIETISDKILASMIEAKGKKYLLCRTAFKIAEEFKIQLDEIGNICNQLGVKISNCQLGCF
jgi:hypothetical protein